jgi:hypothetical protein
MKAVITELLYEDTPDNITQLNKIYKEDRYHARVYYLNSSGDPSLDGNFTQESLYRFEDKDGNMDLVLFQRKYGITKNNKRYISKKVQFRIRIRASGVWVTSNYKIRAYMLHDAFGLRCNHKIQKKIEEIMFKKLAWFRYIKEEFPHMDKSLNYFINKGLYTKKDIIKDQYGFDWPLSKVLYDMDKENNTFYGYADYRKLQFYKDWIINENKFDKELITKNWGIFYDSLKVAKVIDKKINMRWGEARLKQEHIDMSMEMVNIIYRYDESELNNKKCYVEFAEYSGYKLMGTMKELAMEGITKRHCVASYKMDVNRQYCSIYGIGDYTLELGECNEGLYIKQFRGYENKLAPDVLRDAVNDKLGKFNDDVYLVEDSNIKEEHQESLPF